MADTRTFFYPTTAECQAILVTPFPSPIFPGTAPIAPNNTEGGYGGLLDLNDYNGSTGNANIFVGPDTVGTSAGIRDLMPTFSSIIGMSWYLMRQTDFKNWNGVAGIFWKKTSFIMEVDIHPAVMAALGGYRDETPNLSAATGFTSDSPYTPAGSTAQGSGVCLKAIITDPVTHLEVVKDSHIFTGGNGQSLVATPLAFPRQVVQLNLTDITPEEMATMVLRVTTEQYSKGIGDHSPQDSTIYRIGLTPDPASLRSSGKQSATLSST